MYTYVCIYTHTYTLTYVVCVYVSWIQNVAKLRRNGGIGNVLELGDLHFHGMIAAIWNAITVLDQFFRIATETKIATETAF